jgi:hypothetical protein
LDSLVEVGEGPIIVASGSVGSPTIVIDSGIAGLKFDGLVVVGDGSVIVAFGGVGGATVGLG